MTATTELKSNIESKLNNGQTIQTVYNYLIKNLDQYGCASLQYKEHGFELTYISNTNFEGGVKNGGGAGMYAKLHKTGFVKTVKLI